MHSAGASRPYRTRRGGENEFLTIAVPPEKPVGEMIEAVEEDHADAEYLACVYLALGVGVLVSRTLFGDATPTDAVPADD